jgi:UDP-N-acetylglucosamine 4,6-dehydratase
MILVITGGTGSLGKAILNQQEYLQLYGITKIRVISRDEQKQVALMRRYKGALPLDCYLGDVADLERMKFALIDAHYVIHAAAQKHIDKFELDVLTGYRNNIIGTQNVAQAFWQSKCAVSGIFVSTDKAALPITSYGVSKLAAEHVWLWHNTFQKKIRYGVARYGNIFGSRGSVIETWREIAKKKGSFPITNPECTRFFMKIEEAAKFVLNTLFHHDQKVHIPQMKSALMIDVARAIDDVENPDAEKMAMHQVGLRGIEKLHEILKDGGLSSEEAPKWTLEELKELYREWRSEYEKN